MHLVDVVTKPVATRSGRIKRTPAHLTENSATYEELYEALNGTRKKVPYVNHYPREKQEILITSAPTINTTANTVHIHHSISNSNGNHSGGPAAAAAAARPAATDKKRHRFTASVRSFSSIATRAGVKSYAESDFAHQKFPPPAHPQGLE